MRMRRNVRRDLNARCARDDEQCGPQPLCRQRAGAMKHQQVSQAAAFAATRIYLPQCRTAHPNEIRMRFGPGQCIRAAKQAVGSVRFARFAAVRTANQTCQASSLHGPDLVESITIRNDSPDEPHRGGTSHLSPDYPWIIDHP